jgi:hypothetical protein
MLTVLVILSVAAFGYRPALAAMMPADHAVAHVEAAAPVEPMAMPDCPGELQKHDCCDQADKQKPNCAWDAACAARCHINAGIEPVIYMPPLAFHFAEPLITREPRSFVPERPGPLFRPPIV